MKSEINCSFKDLVDTFGKPEELYDEKVQVHWTIKTLHGEVFIYDWKDDRKPTMITEWSIQSNNKEAMQFVLDELEGSSFEKVVDLVERENKSRDIDELYRELYNIIDPILGLYVLPYNASLQESYEYHEAKLRAKRKTDECIEVLKRLGYLD